MIRDIRGLPIFREVGLTVELLKLEYRGNIAKAYIPQFAREALKLDPHNDSSLILVHDDKTGITLLIKDTDLVKIVKPIILDARQIKQKIDTACSLAAKQNSD